MYNSVKKKYSSKDWIWDVKAPLRTLFGLDKKLQDNNYDCGPGVCLLAQAVIQSFGSTGTSEMSSEARAKPASRPPPGSPAASARKERKEKLRAPGTGWRGLRG